MDKKELDTFQKYCQTTYKIDGREIRMGNLTDKQLNVAKTILNNSRKRFGFLTKLEDRQLRATDAIQDYRLSCLFKPISMGQRIEDRHRERAYKTANVITGWITKSYTKN